VEALSNRVRRVCQELATIEQQISSTDQLSIAAVEADAALTEEMKALKGAIDETRAALWSYFQRTQPGPEQSFPTRFPQKIALPVSANAGEVRQKEELCSFFDEIQMLATRIVEKHMNPKTETQ
jgi:hypothetical protein